MQKKEKVCTFSQLGACLTRIFTMKKKAVVNEIVVNANESLTKYFLVEETFDFQNPLMLLKVLFSSFLFMKIQKAIRL